MKLKCALLVCGLTLATVLGGCGSSVGDSHSSIVSEIDKDSDTDKESNQDGDSENADSTNSESDSADQNDNTSDSQPDNQADMTKAVNKAYYEILKAAPAIDSETAEICDAAFGYDDNIAMFGEHIDSFALYDINNDGVQELITYRTINFRWGQISVYTYADGKAVLVKSADSSATYSFDQNASANGGYATYFCEYNHIHSVWSGATPMGEFVEENTAYTVDGTVLNYADYESETYNKEVVYYCDIAVDNTAENIEYLNQ